MNKVLALASAVFFIGVAASPIQPFIGGGAELPTKVEDALHAVMLIALEKKDDQFGTLGGGCIVSTSRIITTAALVAEAEDVRIWFYQTDLQQENRRQARQEWIQPNGRFDSATFLNDIAVLTFRENIFPALNVIRLASTAAAPEAEAKVIGYGFTSPDSLTAENAPLVSEHIVDETCPESLRASATHMCATATTHVVCPGDQGSGIFTGTGPNRELIGIVSIILPGCRVAGPTAFTDLGNEQIQTFLRSQGLSSRPPTEDPDSSENPPAVPPPGSNEASPDDSAQDSSENPPDVPPPGSNEASPDDSVPQSVEGSPEVPAPESVEGSPEAPPEDSPEIPAPGSVEAPPNASAPRSVEASPEETAPESVEASPEVAAPEDSPEAPAPGSVEAPPNVPAPESVEASPEETAPESVEASPEVPAPEDPPQVPAPDSVEAPPSAPAFKSDEASPQKTLPE